MDPDMDLFAIPDLFKSNTSQERPTGPVPAPLSLSSCIEPLLGTQLRSFLAGRYGQPNDYPGRSDGRVRLIRIDDRGPGDVSRSFCDIFVSVPDNGDGLFLLELHHPPRDAEVEGLVEGKGGKVRRAGPSRDVVHFLLPVRPKDGPFLRKLARAVRRVTAKGRSYPDPNWKWLAPRTANALERLARQLDDFRK